MACHCNALFILSLMPLSTIFRLYHGVVGEGGGGGGGVAILEKTTNLP